MIPTASAEHMRVLVQYAADVVGVPVHRVYGPEQGGAVTLARRLAIHKIRQFHPDTTRTVIAAHLGLDRRSVREALGMHLRDRRAP